MLTQFLKYLLPFRFKIFLKNFYYTLQDFVDLLRKKRDKRYPPKRLNFVGSAEFKAIGDEFLEHFKNVGALKPDEAILDIGCGVGRMAIPLTHYVRGGSYVGFDIVKKGIAWCTNNISPEYPNFRFVHANIKNKFYNRGGNITAENYVFPAKNGVFDFCFATSVFTHMLPDEVVHYVEESARVLKPGARAFFTFFLLPELPNGETSFITPQVKFLYRYQDIAYYSHKNCPEAEIGYPQAWVEKLLHDNGFKMIQIYPGTWKYEGGLSYQDILVAERII